MTSDEMADFLTMPARRGRGDFELRIPVRFFRTVDGVTEQVIMAGPTPSLPVEVIYDGFDWDERTTFVRPPDALPLWCDFDDYCAYMERGRKLREGGDAKKCC